MQFTPRPTIGGRSWLSIKLASEKHEKALALWANTTLGLMLHWWHSNKSQPGRSSIGKTALESLPVLDVTTLSASQLNEAARVFSKLETKPLKPMHEIDIDDNRRLLDTEFLFGVVGLDKSLFDAHGPMSVMRAKLAAEPSIRGHK